MAKSQQDALLAWCAQRGITWSQHLQLVSTEDEGGGAVTTAHLPHLSTVISLPRKVALSADTNALNAALKKDVHALALSAIKAKAAPEFAPWVALWPNFTEGTWTLSAAEREALSWCAELRELDEQEDAAAAEAYEEIVKQDGTAAPTPEEWRWGLGLVSSRAADVVINGEVRSVVPPLIDMFNHRSKGECNLALHFDRETDCIVAKVVQSEGIAAGAQLTISYGEKDNAQLLHGYGFATRPNPYDATLMRVPLAEAAGDPLAMQRMAMLPRGLLDGAPAADGLPSARGLISWDPRFRDAAARRVRLSPDLRVLLAMASAASIEAMFGAMSMAAAGENAEGEEGEEKEEGAGGEAADMLPASAWELLAAGCTDALAALPPPPEAGGAAAAAASSTPIMRAAAVALEARQDLLTATLDTAKGASCAASRTPDLT